MKRLKLTLIAMGLFFAAPSNAFAKINIFACSPEWAALSQEIGGDLVKTYTATRAHQDIHYLRAKPSYLAAMRKADLVFCTGAALESGWLPILLQKAGSPNVRQGATGSMMASDFVHKLGVMEHADRSMGDVHPEGNPHVHLNPHNILEIAKILTERLALIDKKNTLTYEKNFHDFKISWTQNIKNWETKAKTLKGKNVIVYHKNWTYLTHWLGMNIIASLEPKPGLPPTTAHLEKVLQTLKNKDAAAILVAPFENDKAAKWLSEKTEIPILHLPYTIGGSENAKTLEALFDETISILLEDTK